MIKNIEDKEIVCSDCGEIFTHTAKAQEFYAEKNLSEPKRCKPCRDKKKADWAAKQAARERGE